MKLTSRSDEETEDAPWDTEDLLPECYGGQQSSECVHQRAEHFLTLCLPFPHLLQTLVTRDGEAQKRAYDHSNQTCFKTKTWEPVLWRSG